MHAVEEKLSRLKPGGVWGLAPQKMFKFWVSEMPSPAFSAGHFQQIKTKENAVISCLFYPSISSVIGKVQTVYGKKG